VWKNLQRCLWVDRKVGNLRCIKQTWNISYNQNGDSLVLANWVCYNVPYDSAEWFLNAPWHITLPTWRGVSGGKQQLMSRQIKCLKKKLILMFGA
jgi:hypothetical protein